MVLLSPGYPANWGDCYDQPQVLGLALESAMKLYNLDSQKVKRLSSNSSDYISPVRVRDLIGLSSDYYISLKIFPFFNITVAKVSDQAFTVTVLNQWNTPIPNVRIDGAYVNMSISDIGPNEIAQFIDSSLEGAVWATGCTDIQGTCTLTFGATKVSLMVIANQLSMKSITTWPTLPTAVVGAVESSMGSVSGYNAETVYRNVNMDGLNYIARLTIWG